MALGLAPPHKRSEAGRIVATGQMGKSRLRKRTDPRNPFSPQTQALLAFLVSCGRILGHPMPHPQGLLRGTPSLCTAGSCEVLRLFKYGPLAESPALAGLESRADCGERRPGAGSDHAALAGSFQTVPFPELTLSQSGLAGIQLWVTAVPVSRRLH